MTKSPGLAYCSDSDLGRVSSSPPQLPKQEKELVPYLPRPIRRKVAKNKAKALSRAELGFRFVIS